ncbi:MAG: hypothetical protein R2705_09375 [Ilumatobacteraceae bacterium]
MERLTGRVALVSGRKRHRRRGEAPRRRGASVVACGHRHRRRRGVRRHRHGLVRRRRRRDLGRHGRLDVLANVADIAAGNASRT